MSLGSCKESRRDFPCRSSLHPPRIPGNGVFTLFGLFCFDIKENNEIYDKETGSYIIIKNCLLDHI